LKIRRDALAISSVLFTFALLMQTPAMINWARTTHQSRFRDISDYPEAGIAQDQVVIPNYAAPTGITSLAIIAIGLVVTWAGYIKGARWTWFVMFVIVWVWVFPVWLLPLFVPWRGAALTTRSIAMAIRNSLDAGPDGWIARAGLEVLLIFLLMLVALVLPIKRFIVGRGAGPGASGGTNLGAPDKRTLPEI
jgi:hypothetical protein